MSNAGRKTALDRQMELLEKGILDKKKQLGEIESLWPAPYNEPTYGSRIAFLEDLCFTWNEADSETQQLPTKDYIRWYVWHWHDCKMRGQPLITEKSRRLILSWVSRCLELHDGGLRPGNYFVAMSDYKDSAEMLWRIWFLYEEIRARNPTWQLPDCTPYGSLLSKKLDSLVLPNGTIFNQMNSEGESVRGSGTTAICCEELSSYPKAAEFWAQANIITQGSAKSVGGFCYALCNASPKEEWQEIKKATLDGPSTI